MLASFHNPQPQPITYLPRPPHRRPHHSLPPRCIPALRWRPIMTFSLLRIRSLSQMRSYATVRSSARTLASAPGIYDSSLSWQADFWRVSVICDLRYHEYLAIDCSVELYCLSGTLLCFCCTVVALLFPVCYCFPVSVSSILSASLFAVPAVLRCCCR